MQHNVYPVLIVGGGLAGLCAAYELSLRGIASQVLEASPRLGGRVHSVKERGDTRLDLGGELIGPRYLCWLRYAERFGLELVDSGFYEGTAIVRANGKILSKSAVAALDRELAQACSLLSKQAENIDLEAPWTSSNAEVLDALSVGDWVAELRISDLSKRILVAELETGNGVAVHLQSYLALLTQIAGGGLDAFWEGTARWRCRGGAGALVEAFERALPPGCVVLKSPVSAIDWADDAVTVRCGNAEAYQAEIALVTVPPSVLSQICFSPGLSQPCTVQMGDAIKSLAVVPGTLPSGLRGYGDAALSTAWTVAQTQQETTFACLSGGPAANSLRRLPELTGCIANELAKFFPDQSMSVDKHTTCDWLSQPWVRGSYSFPAPGEVTSMRDFWARERDGLFFLWRAHRSCFCRFYGRCVAQWFALG